MSKSNKFIATKITDILSPSEILSYQRAYNSGKIEIEDLKQDGIEMFGSEFTDAEIEQILTYVPTKKHKSSKSTK